MKFIHTSDIHLGAPFRGIRGEVSNELKTKLLSSTMDSFSAMIDYAIAEEVDFLLISGDLFDEQNKSVLIQIFLNEQFSRLANNEIDVYISMTEAGDFDEYIWSDKVHILSAINSDRVDINLITTRDKKRVAVIGFSDSDSQYQFAPLNIFPERDKDLDYQIGIYYGDSTGVDENNSFDINQMANFGYDYWALGYLHNQTVLNEKPFIGYPGSIQGLNKNEPGQKGFLLVTESEDSQLVPKFVSTAPIEWQNMIADVAEVTDQRQLINAILNTLSNQDVSVFQLLSIDLNSAENLPEILASQINDGTVLQQLNNELFNQFNQFYVCDIRLNYTKRTIQLNNLDNRYWEVTIDEIFSRENIDQKLFGVNQKFILDYFSDFDTIDNIQSRSQTELLNNQGLKTAGDDE